MTFLAGIRRGWRDYWQTVAELRALQAQYRAAVKFDALGRQRLGEHTWSKDLASEEEWGAGGRQD